jgi:hypothetical protein
MNMKRISIIFSIVVLAIAFNSCGESEYPYDLSTIKKGCLIDVSKVAGSALDLPFAPLSGQAFVMGAYIQVVEKGAGPFTSVDLVLVHNDAKSYIYQSGITTLPTTINIDYLQVVNLIGGENIWIGDKFSFTANVHLPDGTIIYGWAPEFGFNNVSSFAAYAVDGRPYSSNINWKTKTCFFADIPWLNQWWSGPAITNYFRTTTPVINGAISNSTLEVLPADDVPTAAQWTQLGVLPADYENFVLAGFKVKRYFLDERTGVQTGTESSIKIWVNTVGTPKAYIPIQPTGLVFDRDQLLATPTGTPNYQEVFMSGKANYPTEYKNGIDTKEGVIVWVADMKLGTGTSTGANTYIFNKVTFQVKNKIFIRP